MTSDHPLARLFAAACSADAAALEALLDHVRPILLDRLRALLPGYLRDEVAEDLAQDTLLLVAEKITSGEVQWRGREAFEAWLRLLAEGKHSDWWKHVTALKRDFRRDRHEQPGVSGDVGWLEGAARDSETPSRLAVRQEREDALHQAMHELLDADEHEALRLRYVEKLSVNDTAAVLERTPGSIKMLCLRALAKLRQRLEDQGQHPTSR
jgi:RNA polymerase sigma-70 factor (ECF subfamily)